MLGDLSVWAQFCPQSLHKKSWERRHTCKPGAGRQSWQDPRGLASQPIYEDGWAPGSVRDSLSQNKVENDWGRHHWPTHTHINMYTCKNWTISACLTVCLFLGPSQIHGSSGENTMVWQSQQVVRISPMGGVCREREGRLSSSEKKNPNFWASWWLLIKTLTEWAKGAAPPGPSGCLAGLIMAPEIWGSSSLQMDGWFPEVPCQHYKWACYHCEPWSRCYKLSKGIWVRSSQKVHKIREESKCSTSVTVISNSQEINLRLRDPSRASCVACPSCQNP